MELHLIISFMIVAALVAVEMTDLISSVIALSAVGLGLSLAFLILKAPNLAITQIVAEILCVIVLVRSTIKKDLPLVRDGRWFFNTLAAIIFGVTFLIFGYGALKELPRFAEPLLNASKGYIDNGFQTTGIPNLTTAVALLFRHYDALAHMMVLFVAVIGVLAICRQKGKIDEK